MGGQRFLAVKPARPARPTRHARPCQTDGLFLMPLMRGGAASSDRGGANAHIP